MNFTFACSSCGARWFLIRGLCDQCAQDLHAAYRAAMEEYRRREIAFVLETGTDPLKDWYAFESWCERQGLGAIG